MKHVELELLYPSSPQRPQKVKELQYRVPVFISRAYVNEGLSKTVDNCHCHAMLRFKHRYYECHRKAQRVIDIAIMFADVEE